MTKHQQKPASFLERLIFNNRPAVILICLLISIFLFYQAAQVRPSTSFEKMIPLGHPYIQNMLQHRDDLANLGNTVRISVAATLCVILPLVLTSILGNALMAFMGIGVKVATLPVIALGVGIGVDYGIYIYSRLESYLRQGLTLQEAYYQTLKTTGKAVIFTGICLAIGVFTWVFSAIKFQADMGLMLTFMFLWNMVGAIWLLPALARFLIKPEKLRQKA